MLVKIGSNFEIEITKNSLFVRVPKVGECFICPDGKWWVFQRWSEIKREVNSGETSLR